MEKWKYYLPVFESDHYNPQIRNSPWSGHTNFAYDLVRFMKPKKIVELGTYMGSSFFSFCQGVKDENLPTECFAIDTWQGDLHSGFYNNSIFETVSTVVNQSYSGFAKMIRSTFDDAVHLFQNESIDILHIDGYHTFDAVFHDFTTWLPKLAKEGVILFHDTEVREQNFGVYMFWESIKQIFPHIEFKHSHGLGVLFPKGLNKKFESIINEEVYLQNRYTGNFIKNISQEKNSLPLVSILVPTNNHSKSKYLELALNSALTQSYSNIEIIISDDSTNNETEMLVKNKYLPYFKKITYSKNENPLGKLKNIQKLYNLSNGEYINYLMDDALFHDLKIEKMMNYYLMDIDEEIKMITSYRKMIDLNGNALQDDITTRQLFRLDTILNGQQFGGNLITGSLGEPTTVLFRKKDLIYPFGTNKDREYESNFEIASWLTLLNQGKAIYLAEPLSSSRCIVPIKED